MTFLGRVKGLGKRVIDGLRYAEHPARFALRAVSRLDRHDVRGEEFRAGDVRFRVRPSDWCAFEEILVAGEYAVTEELLRGLMAPVVADLGANVGLFAVHVFRISPRAVVHSYEPSAATYALLEGNASFNPDLSWYAHHAAVHALDGQMAFWNAPASTGSRLAADAVGDETVPAVSLATVLIRDIATPVDLMKVDVEGAEEAVLCANPALLDRVRSLIVEIHPDRCDADRVMDVIEHAFPRVWRVDGRASSKPLIAATRRT